MKRALSLFVVITVIVYYSIPFINVKATTQDEAYQYVGTVALTNLILSGQSTALDFSNNGGGSGFLDFVKDLGYSLTTEDWTAMIPYGIDVAETVGSAIWDACTWGYQYFISVINDKNNVNGKDVIPIIQNGMDLFSQGVANILNSQGNDEPYIPPVDYIQYIDHIMNNQMWQGLNYSNNLRYSWETYSFLWCTASWGTLLESYSGGYFYGSTSDIGFMPCQPLEVYVNEVNGSWYITHSTVSPMAPDCKIYQNNNPVWGDYGRANLSSNTWSLNGIQNISNLYSFNYFWWVKPSYISLESAFVDLRNFVSHVTIYVNGVKWSDATSGNNYYPISLGDQLKIYNDYPAQYVYPTPSYYDLDGLYNLIINAINDSDVITYQDIEPFILDVNGQQAVATVHIVRTDYDNLISEQYPIFPTSQTGTLNLPVEMLEEHFEDMQYILNEAGANLIPDDIAYVICGCGVILLIGYLINRMLE